MEKRKKSEQGRRGEGNKEEKEVNGGMISKGEENVGEGSEHKYVTGRESGREEEHKRK